MRAWKVAYCGPWNSWNPTTLASWAWRMPTAARIRTVPGAQPLRSPPPAVWEKPRALNETTLNDVVRASRLETLTYRFGISGFFLDSVKPGTNRTWWPLTPGAFGSLEGDIASGPTSAAV